MSQRLKLTVAYDGSPFAGWQSQTHRKTIQDELERALHRISGARLRVHGAGRTDTGVHALAQCAHVDLPDRRLEAARWTKALNGVLPRTIRVLSCRYVSSNFHARFSAKGKTYRYRIWTGPILPPLELERAWHITAPLDHDLLGAAGKRFIGQHDFAAFAANRDKDEKDTVRTIWSLRVRNRGAVISIEVSGNGFLYKMVRLMVGRMTQAALGKVQLTEIDKNLRSGSKGGSRFAAPAQGLYLVRVWY
ncbi:MAG TPA: tRNA pseudouridine(38-40) synthase TruA [Chthoniobacterales bacterium]|jgi:tRNA pseudouridine38-40 synthase|nr:tRNA pseudouridine(38-40) synthase TruA [Chthoniobacterales bacterium]